jgi:hypothetical protein
MNSHVSGKDEVLNLLVRSAKDGQSATQEQARNELSAFPRAHAHTSSLIHASQVFQSFVAQHSVQSLKDDASCLQSLADSLGTSLYEKVDQLSNT